MKGLRHMWYVRVQIFFELLFLPCDLNEGITTIIVARLYVRSFMYFYLVT